MNNIRWGSEVGPPLIGAETGRLLLPALTGWLVPSW